MTPPLFPDDLQRCMKCGFCMSNCPVYRVDYVESHVARGRNMLIRQAASGKTPKGDTYAQSLSHCLLCGRCRAVCPARVSSPDITVAGRAQMVRQSGLPWAKALVFRGILKHRALMARLAGLAAMLPGIGDPQGKPLRHMADLTAVFSGGIAVPRLSRPFLNKRLAPVNAPPQDTAVRGRVGFFAGCGFEFFFAGMGQAMVRTLTDAGFEVVYPQSQGCCGLAVHSAGDLDTARDMARANISALDGFDHIVTGCATCSTALKNYRHWIPEDDPMHARAEALSDRTWDFSDFLHHHNVQPAPRRGRTLKVTYHDPCHLKWHQNIVAAPRELLSHMEGITYIEMEGADACCGLGGAFGLYHRDISLAIQKKKMAAIAATGADVVVTSCPGCLIQLMDGARRHGLNVEVMHIGQLLNPQTSGDENAS